MENQQKKRTRSTKTDLGVRELVTRREGVSTLQRPF